MASNARWKPSVTVAAVIEQQGRYLLVEEHTADGLRLNNPVGHLDPGQSLLQTVRREVLEETACAFTPSHLVGVYLASLQHGNEDITCLRLAFAGSVSKPDPGRALDTPIVRTPTASRSTRLGAGAHNNVLPAPLLLRDEGRELLRWAAPSITVRSSAVRGGCRPGTRPAEPSRAPRPAGGI